MSKNISTQDKEPKKTTVNKKKAQQNVEEGMEAVNEIDTFSEEEKAQIHEEMEALFQQQVSTDKKISFSSSVPSGAKFPVIFNILLIIALGIGIVVAPIIIGDGTSALDNIGVAQEQTEISLAQDIIEQGNAQLEEQEKELQGIQAQLEALQANSGDLQQEFENNIARYQDQLDRELEEELATLRAALEGRKSLSEDEIVALLREKESELRISYNRKLAAHRTEQERSLQAQEQEFASRIDSLEQAKSTAESEIQQITADLENQKSALNQQLSDTENTLLNLQQVAEEKEKELGKFDLYHVNIIRLIDEQKLIDAKEAILDAKKVLSTNQFQNDPEFKTYLDAYNTYSIMIDGTIEAQKVLESSSAELAELVDLSNDALSSSQAQQQRVLELEELMAALEVSNQGFEDTIARLQGTVAQLQGTIATHKREIATLESTIRSSASGQSEQTKKLTDQITQRNQEIARLEASIESFEQELVKTKHQEVPDELLRQVLQNIEIITNYFALKQIGQNDTTAKRSIDNMIAANSLYESIIDILLLAIDPTGSLTYN